jgi:FtsP/CotA-like multicopper oxidase with cupredoxin domain
MDRTISRREALVEAGRFAIGAAIARHVPERVTRNLSLLRFQRSLIVPPALRPTTTDDTTDYFEITQRVDSIEIFPGTRTPIWGYEGRFPGPTIHARRGRTAIVCQTNHLTVPTVVHLHGGAVPADSDGFPTDIIAPGESRTYVYPNDQPAATLWYHDHAMHHTGRNVYMGLAGLYLIHDDEEDALQLPSGEFDIPLLIQNRALNSAGRIKYNGERNLGATGDIVLVNGVPWPRMAVCARKYRFRVVNGANATVYRLALSTGRPLAQIATDLGFLPTPVESACIPLAMSERMEFVVDFAPYPIGTRVILRNLADDGPQGEIMCFDVVCAERDNSELPSRLTSVERIPVEKALRTREFIFSGGPSFPPAARWTINGMDFEPARAIATPRMGDIEIWRFVNRRRFGILGMVHPVHVHLVRFQIVDRNSGPPDLHETGWKDTVAVSPGQEVRIITKFEGYRGRYLMHCHNLEHEDHNMMARYDVI